MGEVEEIFLHLFYRVKFEGDKGGGSHGKKKIAKLERIVFIYRRIRRIAKGDAWD